MNNNAPPSQIPPENQLAPGSQVFYWPEDQLRSTATNPIAVLLADIRMIYQSDPAARNWLEVLFCYPGLQALWCYRIAHWLHRHNVAFVPRFLSHLSRWLTGIEIHPGASIGKGVFIDHGMGVVIGETTIIGDYVLIYQGATLGGTGKEKGKRHPTIGNHVIVGAGAKVLGNIRIGDHVRIGAGSVVLRDVPGYCTVVGVPGRIIQRHESVSDQLEHNDLRDVEAEVIRALFDRIKTIENQIEQLKEQDAGSSSNQQQSIAKTAAKSEQTAEEDQMIREFLDGAGI